MGRCCMLDRDPASLMPEPILAGGLSSCGETGVETLRPEPRCGGRWSPKPDAPLEVLVWMSTSCLRPSSSSVPSRKGWYRRGIHRSRVVYASSPSAATTATAVAAPAPLIQSGLQYMAKVNYRKAYAVRRSSRTCHPLIWGKHAWRDPNPEDCSKGPQPGFERWTQRPQQVTGTWHSSTCNCHALRTVPTRSLQVCRTGTGSNAGRLGSMHVTLWLWVTTHQCFKT